MKRMLFMLAAIAMLGAGCAQNTAVITTFEECAAAGYPIMESLPRQCRAGDRTFVERLAVPPFEVVPDAFTLNIGESHDVSEDLRVTLDRIEDSRCPKDVQCIWAGELSAVLRLDVRDGQGSQELTLGTTTRKEADAFGYRLLLQAADERQVTLLVTRMPVVTPAPRAEDTVPSQPKPLSKLGEPFTLITGETRRVEGGFSITLESIADSRCPKDVQCIWAGELSVKLSVAADDQAPIDLVLGTVRMSVAEAFGYRISLNAATENSATLTVTR